MREIQSLLSMKYTLVKGAKIGPRPHAIVIDEDTFFISCTLKISVACARFIDDTLPAQIPVIKRKIITHDIDGDNAIAILNTILSAKLHKTILRRPKASAMVPKTIMPINAPSINKLMLNLVAAAVLLK